MRSAAALLCFAGCASQAPYTTLTWEAKDHADGDPLAVSDEVATVRARWVMWFVDATIENHSAAPVRVLWDDASFVDVDGVAHRLIQMPPEGEETSAPQAPTVVPPGARLVARLAPADHAHHWKTSDGSGWHLDRLQYIQWARPQEYEGKTFTLHLQLDVGGEVRRYAVVLVLHAVRVDPEVNPRDGRQADDVVK